MKKPWLFHIIILILLLIAPSLRWETSATKTQEAVVYKWKTDKWSGTQFRESYYIRGGTRVEEVKGSDKWPWSVKAATELWQFAIIINSIIWLVPIIKAKRKMKALKE